MSFKAIDIHPHVISTDEVKYPRDPLGGHQSVWSKERPVSAEQMVQAMDEALVVSPADGIVCGPTAHVAGSEVVGVIADMEDRVAGLGRCMG